MLVNWVLPGRRKGFYLSLEKIVLEIYEGLVKNNSGTILCSDLLVSSISRNMVIFWAGSPTRERQPVEKGNEKIGITHAYDRSRSNRNYQGIKRENDYEFPLQTLIST